MKARIRLSDGTVFTFARPPRSEIPIKEGRQIPRIFIPGVGEIVQDMGPKAPTIDLKGILSGEDAQQDFERLESIAGSGEVVTFQFGTLVRSMLVEEFQYSLQRHGEIHGSYQMSLVQADALNLTKERTNEILGA